MIQKTFGIYGDENKDGLLMIEIGKLHLGCWLKDAGNDKIYSFELFQYEVTDQENIAEIFRQVKLHSKLLNSDYEYSQILWEHEECLLVPLKYYKKELQESFLSKVFGDKNDYTSYCSPKENEKQLVDENVFIFRNSVLWNDAALIHFPKAASSHKYETILKTWEKNKENFHTNFLQLFFYNQHFILLAVKEQKLQLINGFQYQIPADVLYHSLNVCERLQINKEEAVFYLSGLIDLNSGLYSELNQYLLHLKLLQPVAETFAAKEFQDYPLHYFSSFF